MLTCTKCGSVFEDSRTRCPNCGSSKLREANEEDYVLLHRADLYTAQRLAEQFEEWDVKYRLEPYNKGRFSFTYDSEVMPTDQNIYVRYGDLEKAKGLSSRLKETLEQERQGEEEFEDMPRKKRIIVQALSVVAFMSLVMLAVLGADAFANWLKALFGIK